MLKGKRGDPGAHDSASDHITISITYRGNVHKANTFADMMENYGKQILGTECEIIVDVKDSTN